MSGQGVIVATGANPARHVRVAQGFEQQRQHEPLRCLHQDKPSSVKGAAGNQASGNWGKPKEASK
jgi:hypothetical protein